MEPEFRESAFPVWFDFGLATFATIGGVWAATRITGFHVFLGASWGLIIGAIGWVAVRTFRRQFSKNTNQQQVSKEATK